MAADEPREAVTQLYGYAVFLLARTGAAPPAGLEQARQDNAEAMFSGHDIPAEKAAAMQHFVQETPAGLPRRTEPVPAVRGPLGPYLVLGLKEAMLMKSIRFLALLLCAALLLPLVPVHAAQSGGSFI